MAAPLVPSKEIFLAGYTSLPQLKSADIPFQTLSRGKSSHVTLPLSDLTT